MFYRTCRVSIATLLASALVLTGASVAVATDPPPPPDEQVNLRCIYESLIGVPVDDHPDTDTLCFRLARNQGCTGTGESRVCDDETPWPEFTIPPLYTGINYRGRTDAERTQIRVAHIVERSLSTRCDHYTTSDEPTAGAHRRICLSQTVSRVQVIACQSAVTALGYRQVHDLYVDGGTFNCPSAPRSSSTQSQRQTGDAAHVVADEPETGQQQSDDQQSEDTAQVVVTEVVEPETAQQQSEDTAQVVVTEVVEHEVVEHEIAAEQSDDQQPMTRLAWIASEVARKTGQSCSVIDGRVTCAP